MTDTRANTIFCIRYAVRVLERYAKYWSSIGTAFKFISLATGTGAVAAVIAANPGWSLALGVALAVLQALEHAVCPSDKHACALASRRDYARLLSNQAAHTDESLEAAYQAIVADDEVMVGQSLKELAYNDVVREKGLAESALYQRESWVFKLLT